MILYQKTCENCGQTFTTQSAQQSSAIWANHISEECPRKLPSLGTLSESIAANLPGWGDLGKE